MRIRAMLGAGLLGALASKANASEITYDLNYLLAGLGLQGYIVTDGSSPSISTTDVISYDLTLSGDSTIISDLSASNSSLTINVDSSPSAVSLGPDSIFTLASNQQCSNKKGSFPCGTFSYSGTALSNTLSFAVTNASGVTYGGTEPASGYVGVFAEAATPVPLQGALSLLGSGLVGLAILGGVSSRTPVSNVHS